MKLKPILSSLIAVAAISTPTVLFGAAADLDRVLHAGRQGHAEERRQPGEPELLVAESGRPRRTSTCSGRSGRPARRSQPSTQPVHAAGTPDTGQQTTPIIVDGVIYLDTAGRRRHRGRRCDRRQQVEVGADDGEPARPSGPTGTRRGVSIGDGKVYTLAGGNRVVALNKDTGAEVWVVQPTAVGPAGSPGGPPGAPRQHRQGRDHLPRRAWSTSAPTTATGSSAFAVRSSDGGTVWSFFGGAVPGVVVTDVNGVTTDAGATWGPLLANGNSCALTAGATPWLHGALDPELGTFYVTFGNVRTCGSSQDGQERPGDNLFGDTLVAIDMKTGAYKWHHQSIRHDIWDMDNVHSPVLADVTVGGEARKAIYYGSKAHMTFILDRTNGKPLTGAIEMRPVVEGHAPEERADAAVPGAWHLGRQPRARQRQCIVWEKLGTTTSRATRGAAFRTTTATNPTPTATWSTPSRTTSMSTSRSCSTRRARRQRIVAAACGNRTSTSRS